MELLSATFLTFGLGLFGSLSQPDGSFFPIPSSSNVVLPSNGKELIFPFTTMNWVSVFLVSFSTVTLHSPSTGNSSCNVFSFTSDSCIFRLGTILANFENWISFNLFESSPVSGSTCVSCPFILTVHGDVDFFFSVLVLCIFKWFIKSSSLDVVLLSLFIIGGGRLSVTCFTFL